MYISIVLLYFRACLDAASHAALHPGNLDCRQTKLCAWLIFRVLSKQALNAYIKLQYEVYVHHVHTFCE